MANDVIDPFTNVAVVADANAPIGIATGTANPSTPSSNSGAGVFTSLQVGSGSVGMYANRQGLWLGGASFTTATFKVTMAGEVTASNFTATNPILQNATISSIAAGTDLSLQGWSSTLTFSASTYRKVGWASGSIILTDGTTFSITASDTGNISFTTYIYFDKAVSTTALQTSVTGSDAVGTNKILVAVAVPNTDTASLATFQVFGGKGGNTVLVDSIVANSASTNEFISNTAQIKDAIITNAKISDLAVSKLTAGTITSKEIVMAISAGTGDVAIKMGSGIDMTNWRGDGAVIIGLDDSDSDRAKLFIGNYTNANYIFYNGNDVLEMIGCTTVYSDPSSHMQLTIDAAATNLKWYYVKQNVVGTYYISQILDYTDGLSEDGDGDVTTTKTGIQIMTQEGGRLLLYAVDDSSFTVETAAGMALRIGTSTHKATVYCNSLSACPLPTVDNALSKIGSMREPRFKGALKNPKKAHFEFSDKAKQRKYFDIDDLPEECRFINDVGEEDVEVIRTVGFLMQTVRELHAEIVKLKAKK